MSVDLYKAEAKRLADHLADTHGVKLKHTSILAAVATLHGARDWNTLIARHKPGLLGRAVAALAPAGAPAHSVVVGLDEMLYDHPARGLRFGLYHTPATSTRKSDLDGQPVDIEDRNLTRHTLIVGPTGYGWSTLIESLAVQQTIRGGGMLVLDPRSDLHAARLLQQAIRHAGRDDNFTLLLDDARASTDLDVVGYDLFAGTDSSVIARRLAAALLPPTQVDNPGADYYKVRTLELLEVTLDALQAARLPLQLEEVSRVLLQPEQLFSLMDQVVGSPLVVDRLEQVLRPFIKRTKNGREFDDAGYRGTFGALTGRLALMVKTPRAVSSGTRKLELSNVFKQGQVGYVTGCGKTSNNGLVRGLMDDLMRVFDARRAECSRAARTNDVPFLLVVPCLTSVLNTGAIRRLLLTAAEANVALVFHVTSLSQLDEEGLTFADEVLTNTRLKVFFKQPAPRAFEQAAACLEYAAGGGKTGDLSLRERLMQLGMGEALFFDGRAVCDLRIRTVRQDG